MDWIALLKTVAPGIAAALGGPLAGIAVSAIGNALGIPEPTQEKIQAAIAGATPDDLLKLKLGEEQFQKDMKALDIQIEQIAAGDRDSARKLQASTRSLTLPILSWGITVGFFAILIGMLTGSFEHSDNQVLILLLGSLATSYGMVISFHFGSSSQSHLQTRMLGENNKH